MTTVRQLLDGKSPEVHAVAPDAAVIDAIRLMAEKGIGAVLVMDGPRLVGILSERDYARKIVLRDRSSRDTAVAEIMTAQVVTVAPGEQVEHCLQLVTDYRIRHLPVVEGAQVLGVISIGDLVKSVIDAQRRELDQLQQYIVAGGVLSWRACGPPAPFLWLQAQAKAAPSWYVGGRRACLGPMAPTVLHGHALRLWTHFCERAGLRRR